MEQDTSINQKDLMNSIFELGDLIEEVDKDTLKKLASSPAGKKVLTTLIKARKKGLLSVEQLKDLIRDLKTLKEKYGSSQYFTRLLNGLGITFDDRLEPDKIKLRADILLSSSFEEALNKRGPSSVWIMLVADVLYRRRRYDLDIINHILRIYGDLKKVDDSFFWDISVILLFALDEETFKGSLQLIKTYAEIDEDLMEDVLLNIKNILRHHYKILLEETEERYGKLDWTNYEYYEGIFSRVNDYLRNLLRVYLRENVIKKLAEYIKKDEWLAKKLSHTVGWLSVKEGMSLDDIINVIDNIIDNIDYYYSVDQDLANSILEFALEYPRGVSILFNKSIKESLVKIPKGCSKWVAYGLVRLGRTIGSEDEIELVVRFMNEYGIKFPELVRGIIHPRSYSREAIELLLDEDLKNILLEEYSGNPDTREFVAGIIGSLVEDGYTNRIKQIFSNPTFRSNFRRVLGLYQDIMNIDSVDLRFKAWGSLSAKIKEMLKYNNWDKAIEKLATILGMYNTHDWLKIVENLNKIRGEDKTMEALNILERYAPSLKAAMIEMYRRSLLRYEYLI